MLWDLLRKKYLDGQLPVMLDNAIKRVMNTVNIDGIDSRDILLHSGRARYNNILSFRRWKVKMSVTPFKHRVRKDTCRCGIYTCS